MPNRQDHMRAWYREHVNASWRDPERQYYDLVDTAVHPGDVVLEIGIGHSVFFSQVYKRASEVIGLDPEKDELEKNPVLSRSIVGSVEDIPLKDHSVDVIVMTWVLEHLPHPGVAFRECARVLRPGGRLLCITPNVLAPHVWIARLIPQQFHEAIARRAYGRGEHETYPTLYRANRRGTILRLLASAGFTGMLVTGLHDPTYLGFTKPLLWISHVLSTLLRIPGLSVFRSTIIVEAQKSLSTDFPKS